MNLMIIDDEPLVRQGLQSLIDWNSYGFTVLTEAGNGEEGLEKVLRLSPDIVLLDIRMPGLSGVELMRRAREEGFRGRFILLTGYADFEYAREGIKYGATDYLLKPVDPDELEASIRRAMRQIETERKLEALGVKVYRHYPIADYPSNIGLIVSDDGYGKNEYIETSRPIVIVTAPGPGSGKMATCLSQLYQEHKRGVNAGYAKYETFPIWNLPLKHPVNLAYEAATADLADVNMIDPFHLEAYGETTVNYNRDIEIYPVLETIFRSIFGECPYKSPTDMGVNMAGFAICDDEACREASYQEIIRRYFASACAVKKGVAMPEELRKQEMLMNSLHLDVSMRRTVPAARAKAAETGAPAAAIELPDGRLVTGKTSGLMGASCAALLNAIKLSAGIDDRVNLISPMVLAPIQHLKIEHLGNSNPRLHTDEVLIALSISAVTNPTAELAMEALASLRGSQVHSSVILSSVDEGMFKRLGMNVTFEPVYQSHTLYHK